MAPLHPLMILVRKSKQPRLRSAEDLVAMPYADLVRYCEALLTPQGAVEIMASCFDPDNTKSRGARKTHCSRGHLLNGGGRCDECNRARSREYSRKRRELSGA